MEDTVREFTDLTGRQLPALNQELQAKKLAPIRVIAEDDWRKSHADELPSGRPVAQAFLPVWAALAGR